MRAIQLRVKLSTKLKGVKGRNQVETSEKTTGALVIAALFSVCLSFSVGAADDQSWDMLAARPEVVQAWQDMRFGIFVCWGPVTLTGQEIGWSRGKARADQREGGGGSTPVEVYDHLYKRWHPDKFDARAWVKVAQEAGAKYMIFLVKHHDGFCLYDTQLTDYKSTGPDAAWKHDAMKDIADACHAADLKLIVYYSQPDWHHPDYRTANHARYIQYFHGQIRELLTHYGQIDGLWFDLCGLPTDWDSEKLFQMARGLQPQLIFNNRVGLKGDYDTPEQQLGGFQLDRPWETCMTLGTQWSWKSDDQIKSFKECIHALVTCAVRGGNLALNTNPMPDGQIEPRQVDRFREVGQWLAKYGESIYRTRGGPFRSMSWGGTTHRDNTLFVHVLNWRGASVTLPPCSKKIIHSSVLTGGTVKVKQSAGGTEISVPPADRQEVDTIIMLTFDGPASELKPLSTPGIHDRTAKASTVWGSGFEADKVIDGDDSTRWGAALGTRSGWIEIDLLKSKTITHAVIDEGDWNRVREFQLQALQDGDWKTVVTGTTLGPSKELTFAPVKAQVFRLNILKAVDVPTIWEIELLENN